MTARRLIPAALAVLALLLVLPAPAEAQFTPRFSARKQGPPLQWNLGLTTTVVNLGDYTSEHWPVLKAAVPVFGIRGALAVPIKGETLYLVPELEVHISSTSGAYAPPSISAGPGVPPGTEYDIADIPSNGFSVMANLVHASADGKTLLGGGIGYHLISHDPKPTASMQSDGTTFFRDPFTHLGLGVQVHLAKQVAQLSEKTHLMAEGRYRVASLGGNVSDRVLLLSDFQLTLYLAIK